MLERMEFSEGLAALRSRVGKRLSFSNLLNSYDVLREANIDPEEENLLTKADNEKEEAEDDSGDGFTQHLYDTQSKAHAVSGPSKKPSQNLRKTQKGTSTKGSESRQRSRSKPKTEKVTTLPDSHRSQSNKTSIKRSGSHTSSSKKLAEKGLAVDFTQSSNAYMERIEQVYRHYTVNDQHTLGLNGFLKFLKDLNLLKKSQKQKKQQVQNSDLFLNASFGSSLLMQSLQSKRNNQQQQYADDSTSDDCVYIDPKGMGKISKAKAVILFTTNATSSIQNQGSAQTLHKA